MIRALLAMCLLACQSPSNPSSPGQETADQEVLHTGPAPWTPDVGAVGVPTRVLMSGWTAADAAPSPDATSLGAIATTPESLDDLLSALRITTGDDLWGSVDQTRETLIVLWGTPQQHTTDEIWLVAVWQVGGLVDIQWRIPEEGEAGGGRPWMVLAVQSPGVTDLLVELDYQPVD